MKDWMGVVRKRDKCSTGKDVGPRHSLAGVGMMVSLNARSKHDLGPLRCSGALAPPRVLG
jgi:hypothetical protein